MRNSANLGASAVIAEAAGTLAVKAAVGARNGLASLEGHGLDEAGHGRGVGEESEVMHGEERNKRKKQ
jgi:hypothetical protein